MGESLVIGVGGTIDGGLGGRGTGSMSTHELVESSHVNASENGVA